MKKKQQTIVPLIWFAVRQNQEKVAKKRNNLFQDWKLFEMKFSGDDEQSGKEMDSSNWKEYEDKDIEDIGG